MITIIKIAPNVTLWMVSIKVFWVVFGTMPSTIYLLPTAANNPPTASPNLLSGSRGFILKTINEIIKATYNPVTNLIKVAHECCLVIAIVVQTAG